MDVGQIISVAATVTLVIGLTVVSWYFRSEYVDARARKQYLRAREFVWELVLAAEKRFKSPGSGAVRLEWVKGMVEKSPFAQYISADVLEVWVDYMLTEYEESKETSKDG